MQLSETKYKNKRSFNWSIILIIQGDSVARGPKLFIDNSLGLLATESPCVTHTESPTMSLVDFILTKIKL